MRWGTKSSRWRGPGCATPNASSTILGGRTVRPHFDLWQANQAQLVEAGVAPEHVEISAIDTARTTDEFFSHRAERGRCGLFTMVAWLDPDHHGSSKGSQTLPAVSTSDPGR